MRKEVFKVNEEDYKLLHRVKATSPEQKKKDREETIKLNTRRVKHFNRVKDHKQKQVNENKSLEKHEAYIDGKKPIFMVHNEVEEIQAQIEQLEEQIKLIQEELKKEE